ncbi:MFS transporter [Paenibacillus thiaminolyticus]|uniref:MFS transporter n=1 Tax=Paenibacillus thiaminolyticus TaxID=49283 RepID=UPI002330116E|nr:MFS transporter [Paenibacillus thiaminolyticus]WCF06768.1 MFS transporter [Paenibacillus thiaminolyticus]
MKLLFSNSSYRRLWWAQLISELGDGITRLVVIFLVAHLSASPLALSMVVLSQVLPQMLFGAFVGPLVDRINRPLLMAASDIYRAGIVLAFILAQDSLPFIYVLIWLQGIGTVFFEPARSALIPRLVGKEQISSAVSLSQATYMAMRLVGPALAGLLIPLGHFGWLFTFNAITFLLSAVFVFSLRGVEPLKLSGAQAGGGEAVTEETEETEEHEGREAQQEKEAKLSYMASFKEGLTQMYRHEGLFALIMLVVPVMLVVGVINSNLNAALLQTFRIPAEHFGFVSSVIGAGSIVGAIAAPHLLRRIQPSTLLLIGIAGIGASCIFIVPLAPIYANTSIISIYIWSLLTGFTISCTNVPLSSLFLTLMPDEIRGRGAAVFGTVAETGTVIGIGLGGLFAVWFGVLEATAVAGGLLVIVSIVFPLLKYSRALKYKASGTMNPPEGDAQAAIPS